MMDLEEALKNITAVTDFCEDLSNDYLESLDAIVSVCNPEERADMNKGGLKNLFDNIEPSIDGEIHKFNQAVKFQEQCLQKKRNAVNELKAELDRLSSECEKKKGTLEKTKKECASYEKKAKMLENTKKSIRVFKALTGTHFVYKKDRTTGYILTDNPQVFEVFDWEHSMLSQEHIRRELWKLMDKVAKEKSLTHLYF